jgi:hypothetical protein
MSLRDDGIIDNFANPAERVMIRYEKIDPASFWYLPYHLTLDGLLGHVICLEHDRFQIL